MVGGARRVSDDKRKVSLTLAVDRLPGDGSAATAERRGFGCMNTEITSQRHFSSGLSAGKLELSYYDRLEDVDVPIDLVVARPY